MTYKITPGEYLTRDGRKAVVLCDDAPGEMSLIGYVVQGKNGYPASWDNSGGRFQAHTDPADLMPPVTEPEQVVRWVELYQDDNGNFWAKADKVTARPLYANIVARTRVVLTPGVFEDEATPDPYTRGWNEALEAACDELIEFRKIDVVRQCILSRRKIAP